MSYVLSNFINTTLAAAAASGATSMTLASSVGFPTLVAGQIMPLVINDVATGLIYEIVYVTAISGAILTVTRAQEGTSAQNWSIGDYTICAPTAATVRTNRINEYIIVDVSATSDATLTNTQYSAELINMAGVTTTNQNVIVPAVAAQWMFANNTSGSFTRTVKTPAGTGIVVPQGAAMLLYCDGINVLSSVTAIVTATNQSGGTVNATTGVFSGAVTFAIMPNCTTRSMVRLNTANLYGSTNAMIRRFTNTVTNQGTDITYADSATLGATFTINTNGVYSISYTDQFNALDFVGISLNTTQPNTGIQGLTNASEILSIGLTIAANYPVIAAWTGYLPAGSVVRAHTDSALSGTNVKFCSFTITRVN